MKDEKKIEDAAKVVVEKEYTKDIPIIKNTFKNGFHKGIDCFLDNLWHDASEEPKTFKRLIAKCHSGRVKYEDMMFIGIISWNEKVKNQGIINWLYIDDLFQKEGGEG